MCLCLQGLIVKRSIPDLILVLLVQKYKKGIKGMLIFDHHFSVSKLMVALCVEARDTSLKRYFRFIFCKCLSCLLGACIFCAPSCQKGGGN
jgi:hypothetical protein